MDGWAVHLLFATYGRQASSRLFAKRWHGKEEAMGIPQGDLKLLDSDMAKRLLNSKIPARLAYTAKDGTPRVIPTWFHWDGSELVMATYIAGPHVSHAPARPAALRANPAVAITIDTET